MNSVERVNSANGPWPEVDRLRVNGRAQTVNAPAARIGDRLELSELGEHLADRIDSDALRTARLERVRRQIAGGTYVTPHKLDVTADRLSPDLGAVDLSV